MPFKFPKSRRQKRLVSVGRIRKRNAKRKAKRFLSDFGGKDYLEYVKSFSCAICGANKNWSVAAHLTSRGAGGKAEDTVALCRTRYGIEGCHERYDAHDPEIRKHEPRLRKLASERWQAYLNTQEKSE
jgi:hypothetical protein